MSIFYNAAGLIFLGLSFFAFDMRDYPTGGALMFVGTLFLLLTEIRRIKP